MFSSARRNSDLVLAVREGRISKLKENLQSSITLELEDGGLSFHAISDNFPNIIELLLENCSIVSNSDLVLTVREGRISKLKENLQSSFAHELEDGGLPFHAISDNFPDIIELLLENGSKVNKNNETCFYTPLHLAANHGDIKIVEMLVNRKANVNAQDIQGRTPIYCSIEENQIQVTEFLLSVGASMNVIDINGLTPLHIAVENGHVDMFKMLLKYHGKNILEILNDWKLLHIAVMNDDANFVNFLLNFGIDVDATDDDGRTALRIACKSGYKKCVIALLGFCPNIKSVSYWNPFLFPLFQDSYFVKNEIAEIIGQHIVKLKTANLFEFESDKILISSSCNFDDGFEHKCEKEIESLKTRKVAFNVSLYDMLSKSISQIAIYTRNKDLVQVFKSSCFETNYPIYGSLINNRFNAGIQRQSLMEQSIESFYSIFHNVSELPLVCGENVLSYLSIADLRILNEACYFTSIQCSNFGIDMPSTKKQCIFRKNVYNTDRIPEN